MKIIAIEEHFTSPAVFAHLGNTKASGIMTKLRDMGALRLKEMDEAGIDYALLSENNPAAQNLAPDVAIATAKASNDFLFEAIQANPTRFGGFATLPTPAPKADAGSSCGGCCGTPTPAPGASTTAASHHGHAHDQTGAHDHDHPGHGATDGHQHGAHSHDHDHDHDHDHGHAHGASCATAAAPASSTNGSTDDARIPPVEPKELQKAVSQLTDTMRNLKRSLEFSIDEASGRTVVTVIDKETNEVIRQIPEKDLLALTSRLEKAAGLLLNEEA